MAIHLRGNLDPKEQSRTYKFDPTNGDSLVQVWRNFDEDKMNQLADQYRNAGVAYEFNIARDICTLTAQDARGEYTIDSWQVAANAESPSISHNPVVYAGIYAEVLTDSNVRARLRNIFKSARGEGVKVENGDLNTEQYRNYLASSGSPYCARILDLVVGGVTSYASANYVLRHTTNVSNRWDSNVSDDNVSLIYSTSELLSEAEDSGLWLFPLPGRLSYKILTVSNFLISQYGTPANQAWGWLKQPSTETSAANNRVDIVTEYWFDRWSTDLYEEL